MKILKPNNPYPPSVKPDDGTLIRIMLQSGWSKKGKYELGKWFILDPDEIEIKQSDIHKWWII